MRLVYLAGLLMAGLVAAAPVDEEKRQTSELPSATFTGQFPRPTGTRSHRHRPTSTGVVERPVESPTATGTHTRRPHSSFTGSFERPTGAPTFGAYPPSSTDIVARDGVDSDAPTGISHSTTPRPTAHRPQPTRVRPSGTRAVAGERPTRAHAGHHPSSTGTAIIDPDSSE